MIRRDGKPISHHIFSDNTVDVKAFKAVILDLKERFGLKRVIPTCRQTGKIERVFRELKSYLEIQPIYHYVPRRIKAHIFLCFLALLLEWEFTKRLKEMEPDIPPIR